MWAACRGMQAASQAWHGRKVVTQKDWEEWEPSQRVGVSAMEQAAGKGLAITQPDGNSGTTGPEPQGVLQHNPCQSFTESADEKTHLSLSNSKPISGPLNATRFFWSRTADGGHGPTSCT